MRKLRASSIMTFRTCTQKYRLAIVEGILPDVEADALHKGSSWHKALDVYEKAESDKMLAAVEFLNERYAERPVHKTPEEWGLEHVTMVTLLAGYIWRWQNDPTEVLATEIPFELPVYMPRTGLPLPASETVRSGTIDAIVRWQGKVGILERKTTAKPIDPDSGYWAHWTKDIQVSTYTLALREMKLPNGITIPDGQYANVIVDIVHKPTISPKMLTQGDTAKFIETGEYMGEKFTAEVTGESPIVRVDGEMGHLEMGKKGFAIRETLRMFSARLLLDIQERPDFYFARREIARTDRELAKFKTMLYNVDQQIANVEKHNLWTENEAACDSPYKCQFHGICYGVGADAVANGGQLPQGYKRVDLTIAGREVK